MKPDYIVCLEDGKKPKMLKRYLRTHYNMSPEEYRTKWNLPRDYPMVAPGYAETRRSLAKSIGLGRKKPIAEVPAAVETVKQRAKKVGDAVMPRPPRIAGRAEDADTRFASARVVGTVSSLIDYPESSGIPDRRRLEPLARRCLAFDTAA